jgi:hypothetical protein
MLSEERITQVIALVIQDLKSGNLEQASRKWMDSGFELLMNPIQDPAADSRLIDPAADYRGGHERVHETGNKMRRCLHAITACDADGALKYAKEAADRWAAGRWA